MIKKYGRKYEAEGRIILKESKISMERNFLFLRRVTFIRNWQAKKLFSRRAT